MLEKIRNKAGLLVVVVGVALFAFIIGDLLNSGSTFFRQSQEVVADVDGNVISIHDYQARVDEMADVYRMQTGSNSMPETMMTQIRQSVFNTMVQEIVLGKTTSDLGLVVTSDELFDLVQGENISPMIQQMQLFVDPETGQFDRTLLLNFLKTIDDDNLLSLPAEQRAQLLSARSFWLFWEKNIKAQSLSDKYTTLLTKAVSANILDAKDAHDATIKNSDLAYTMQSYYSIPDSTITLSQGELKALYEQRKSSFKQKEGRVINYITVDIVPSQEDYSRAQAEVERIRTELLTSNNVAELVNETSETPYLDVFVNEAILTAEVRQFVEEAEIGAVFGPVFEDNTHRLAKLVARTTAPDSIKISHIMLAGLTEDAVAHLADSLHTELRRGADFAELAEMYSIDGSASMGGELGWFTEATAIQGLGAEFKDAIFSAALNEVVSVESLYGTHLVKITEKTSPVRKSKIAAVEKTVVPSSRTYSNIYNELNQYISKNSDINKMAENARDAGYNVLSNVTVTADDQNLGFIENSRQVIRWAFDSKKGEISDIFECNDKFVVASVLGRVKEGYRSLESVTPLLKPEILAKKKGEKISQDLLAKNLTSLESYAEAMNGTVDTVRFVNFATPRIAGIGVEPRMNAMIYLAKENQLSNPVVGANGVYVFNVFSTTNDAIAFDEEATVQGLNLESSYRLGYQAVQELINNATIEDNRIRFY